MYSFQNRKHFTLGQLLTYNKKNNNIPSGCLIGIGGGGSQGVDGQSTEN